MRRSRAHPMKGSCHGARRRRRRSAERKTRATGGFTVAARSGKSPGGPPKNAPRGDMCRPARGVGVSGGRGACRIRAVCGMRAPLRAAPRASRAAPARGPTGSSMRCFIGSKRSPSREALRRAKNVLASKSSFAKVCRRAFISACISGILAFIASRCSAVGFIASSLAWMACSCSLVRSRPSRSLPMGPPSPPGP